MILSGGALIEILDGIIWIDRLFIKSLSKAVPDYHLLLDNPTERLSDGPIYIGPRRRYATALCMGVLISPAAIFSFVSVLAAIEKYARLRFPNDVTANAAIFACIVVGAVAAMVVSFWLWRGGRMVLTLEGVELRHRRSVVWCPWSLFDAPGQPFDRMTTDVTLPVSPKAVPSVELRKNDLVVARGEAIRSRQLRFPSNRLARMSALYSVKIGDLADLLLHLGCKLGKAA